MFHKIFSSRKTEKLPDILATCELRFVPNKRKVTEGVWQDKKVIVKTFLHKIHGYRHMIREWSRLKTLQQRHILAPTPLLQGKNANQNFCLVTAKIENAITADEMWQKLNTIEEKKQFITNIVEVIAEHHEKMLLQKDLHLANFLVQNNQIYTLDPSQIQIFHAPIPRSKCIAQIALLLSQHMCLFPFAREILLAYARMRKYEMMVDDLAQALQLINSYKEKRIRKTLKKYQRKNSKHHFIRNKKVSALVDVTMGTKNEVVDFVDHLEKIMQSGKYLKEGGTAYVALGEWQGKKIIIKRYNYKNLWYSFRQTFKKRRGQNSWVAGHHLTLLEIPTAKPLAYIEKYKYGLFEKSYIVMEYMEHQNFNSFFKEDTIPFKTKEAVAKQVFVLLNQLHTHKISHGDLKYMNILIANESPVLIDLDSMIFHNNNWKNRYKYKDKRKKDIQRFLANIKQFPQLEPFFGDQNAQNHKSLYT